MVAKTLKLVKIKINYENAVEKILQIISPNINKKAFCI